MADLKEMSAAKGTITYSGFISYSHAADGLLAPRLQAALQRFAKPWWQRRALRIFRDESSLSANPHLWSSIETALDQSGWFVLLLSPDAAASPWVGQEIDYWVKNRDLEKIIPVLTEGTFEWDDGDVVGTSVPDQLRGVFAEEPRWVDLRFAKGEEQLDLKNPRFSAAVADIASALRGVPKDELESEEVRQHRAAMRTAWAAGILVLLLGATAAVAAIVASRHATEAATQRDAALAAEQEAERQARLARARELGSASIEVLDEDPRLARLLALQAVDVTGATDEIPDSVVNSLWQSLSEDRLVTEVTTELPGFDPAVMSEDGTRLALSSDEGRTLVMYSIPDGVELWRYSDSEAELFGFGAISADGSLVAIGVVNTTDPANPTRVVVLDGSDGSLVQTMEYPNCPSIEAWGWTTDSSRLVFNNGVVPCPRDEAPDGIWAEVRDTETWESLAVIPSDDPWVAEPIFDAEGNLYLFGLESPAVEYSAGDYSHVATYEEALGLGDVSNDGSMLATFTPYSRFGLRILDTDSGEPRDTLAPISATPVHGLGIRFSVDGSQVIVGTEGNDTYVWDTANGTQVHSLPTGPSHSANLSPDLGTVYTTHRNGVIRVWDLGPQSVNTTVVSDLDGHDWVNANSFSFGGGTASLQAIDLAGECDPICSVVRLFDTESGVLLDEVGDGYNHTPLPDGRVLFIDPDFQWAIYDPATRETSPFPGCRNDEPEDCIGLDGGEIVDARLSADQSEIGIRVEAPDRTERLIVLDNETLRPVDETSSSDLMFVFTADHVLTLGPSSYAVLERGTGREVLSEEHSSNNTEVSPSGKYVAMVTFGGDLLIADLSTWERQLHPVSLGQVRGMAFDANDEVIALSDEASLHIFDLDAGLITQTIPIGGVSDMYFLDADTMVIGTNDGLWATVSLSVDDLVESARHPHVPRGFTTQECATYRLNPCPTTEG